MVHYSGHFCPIVKAEVTDEEERVVSQSQWTQAPDVLYIKFKKPERCSEIQCPTHTTPPGFRMKFTLSPSTSSGQAWSKGWHDEDDTPVIPGEQRETRNPGAENWSPACAGMTDFLSTAHRYCMAGLFISFEGIEGSGKSTQVVLLADALRAHGHEVVVTREPGGTPRGQVLRQMLLDPTGSPLAPRAELLMMLADRAQHVQEIIAPGLFANKVVITDRFVDSTTAYQGYGRGFDRALLQQLNTLACGGYMPAMTFLMDLPVTEGLQRARHRRGETATADHFEAESVAFHERVRDGFLAIARSEPHRVHVLDATRPKEEVHHDILAALQRVIFYVAQ
jgi:dTMP kinase